MIAYASKWAIAAGSIYGLVEKVGKPYYDWRKNRWAGIVREALKPELEAMNELKHTSDSLTEMIELVLLRQKEMFEEMDMFMVLASDNKDRHDETNDLLTAAGFSSDRRFDLAGRERIETLFRELNRRKTERLRLADREKKAESVIAQILKP